MSNLMTVLGNILEFFYVYYIWTDRLLQIIWQTHCRYGIVHKNAHFRCSQAPSGFKTHDCSVGSEENSTKFMLHVICDYLQNNTRLMLQDICDQLQKIHALCCRVSVTSYGKKGHTLCCRVSVTGYNKTVHTLCCRIFVTNWKATIVMKYIFTWVYWHNSVFLGRVKIKKCSVGALPLVSGVHKLLMERLPDHLCN